MAVMVKNKSIHAWLPLPDPYSVSIGPGSSVILADTPANVTATLGAMARSGDITLTTVQDGQAGAITPTSLAAKAGTFTASTPAQWATSAPTDPQTALNRLASAVYALRASSPIP